MNLGLKGKTAVVTAASRGLGRAVAERLAEEGADLMLCSRNLDAVRQAADELKRRYGVRAEACEVNVGSAADIERLIAETMRHFNRIDALVCNAGGPPSGAFLSLSDDAWESAFQTTMMSVVRLVRGFYPHMRSGGGKIVTIASSSVKMPIPGLVLSNTLRAGIAGLMKTLSIELGADGILLNTVCPGRIGTDRLQELDNAKALRENRTAEDVKAEMLRDIPLGRYGEPEELAALCAFLLSGQNTYLTGSVYYVDGGMVKAL